MGPPVAGLGLAADTPLLHNRRFGRPLRFPNSDSHALGGPIPLAGTWARQSEPLRNATVLEVRFSLVGRSLPWAGMAGLLLTSLGSVATAGHVERRLLFVEVDALLIILGYLGAMVLPFNRGIVGRSLTNRARRIQ